MVKSLRIGFMGTPDFSVPALQALIDSHHDVVCVYSQPPRPKGRGKKIIPSPIQQCAERNNIDVRYPINFKDEKDVADFQALNLDLAIVAAYGLILPKNILEASKYGCINIHASILPRWRGAAPIHRAIEAGDDKSGITLMQMDEGLDTGDMIITKTVSITLDMTSQELHDRLSDMGAKMIVPCVDLLAEKEKLEAVKQSEDGMTYAKMLKKEEGHIDWRLSALEIEQKIRAFNPWPSTWSILENGKRLKVIEADISDQQSDKQVGTILDDGLVQCGDKTTLQLKMVQPENKNPMDVKIALNGGHIKAGDRFS